MRNPKAKVSDPNSFVSDPGSDTHILYTGRLLESGEILLSESGKESISQKINADKEFTDIAYIRQRLAMGDTSVLRSDVSYGDYRNLPKDMRGALDLLINAERTFDTLPVDVKEKFNNSYLNWLQTSGSEDWSKKMFPDEFKEKVDDLVIEKESVADES